MTAGAVDGHGDVPAGPRGPRRNRSVATDELSRRGRGRQRRRRRANGRDLHAGLRLRMPERARPAERRRELRDLDRNRRPARPAPDELHESRRSTSVPPQGSIRCRIPRFPLIPGTYLIATYVEVGGELADHLTVATQLDVEPGDFFGTGHTGVGRTQPLPRRRLVVALRKRLDRFLARGVEGAQKAERSSAAGRAAALFVVALGDRLGLRASARARTFLVRHVLRGPIVFTDRFGLRYVLSPSDAVYESFLNDGYYERREQHVLRGVPESRDDGVRRRREPRLLHAALREARRPRAASTPSSPRRATSRGCGRISS